MAVRMASVTVSSLLLACCFLAGPALPETLIGSREPCLNEGREVSVHSIKDMRCFTCMCKNGFVECQREGCPDQQGCFMLMEQQRDQCCQQCKGCIWEGVEHPSGSEWTKKDDPCRVYRCHGGVITETKMVCHMPCQSPLPPREGECCPVCKGCVINGQEVGAERDATIPDDPCLKCHCREGANGERSLRCTKEACPVLQCPPSKQTKAQGQCCPTCIGSRTVRTLPRNRCMLVSEVRQEGEWFSQAVSHPMYPPPSSPPPPPFSMLASTNKSLLANQTKAVTKGGSLDGLPFGNCTRCRCGGNATVHCVREACPVLECPLERRVWPIEVGEDGTKRRSCCMKCLEERAEARRQCVHDGVIYKEGERRALDPCRSCVCQSGVVRCAVEVCTGPGALVVTSKGLVHHTLTPSSSLKAEPNTPCPPNTRLYHPNGTCCPTCIERDGVCSVFGDPHYRTFDGKFYSFQGACKYLLTSDQCDALLPANESAASAPGGKQGSQSAKGTFSIRVTNDARGTFSSAWTKTISIKAHGMKVSLGQKMRVKLNGKRSSLPLTVPRKDNATLRPASPLLSPPQSSGLESLLLTVKKEGGGIVLWLYPGIVIIWDGSSFLEVSVPTSYKNKLCGLCGNYNDDPKDDLTPRRGSRTTLPPPKPTKPNQAEAGPKRYSNNAPNNAKGRSNVATVFASSWRVGGKKACSRLEDSDVRWPIKGRHLKTGPRGSPPRPMFPPLNPPLPFAPGIQTAMWGVATMCRGGASIGSHRSLERRRRKMRERYHKCRTLRSPTFAVCHDRVNPTMYIRSCLSDLCECPKGARCHCSALKAYAHACRRALQSSVLDDLSPFTLPPEINNWRNETGCEESPLGDGVADAASRETSPSESSSSEEEEEEERLRRLRRKHRRRRRRRRRRRKRKRLQQLKQQQRNAGKGDVPA
ncbi:kielin/chordin-like protein [Ischnura elegans]|uniref:kielin/chordin-like protein n=1 Tax=Ischnura elegans TaxID=197161 RepID=UPI001ED8863F|nr:kielin/chordin-like protein [Ischnura elegans]